MNMAASKVASAIYGELQKAGVLPQDRSATSANLAAACAAAAIGALRGAPDALFRPLSMANCAMLIARLMNQNGGVSLPYLLVTEDERKHLVDEMRAAGLLDEDEEVRNLRILDTPIVTRVPPVPSSTHDWDAMRSREPDERSPGGSDF
jgi:hypothetical protein